SPRFLHPRHLHSSLHDALPIFALAAISLFLLSAGSLLMPARASAPAVEPQSMDEGAIHRELVLIGPAKDGLLRAGFNPTGSIKVDRKSTRLNSSHVAISYAVFC